MIAESGLFSQMADWYFFYEAEGETACPLLILSALGPASLFPRKQGLSSGRTYLFWFVALRW